MLDRFFLQDQSCFVFILFLWMAEEKSDQGGAIYNAFPTTTTWRWCCIWFGPRRSVVIVFFVVSFIKVSWVATWSDEMLFFSDFPIRHSHFRIVLYLEQNTSTHTRHDASSWQYLLEIFLTRLAFLCHRSTIQTFPSRDLWFQIYGLYFIKRNTTWHYYIYLAIFKTNLPTENSQKGQNRRDFMKVVKEEEEGDDKNFELGKIQILIS